MSRERLITVILGTALITGVTACSDEKATMSAASEAGETALEHAARHLDPKYVCPMHPQILRDKPGRCPICGMDLVEKKQDGNTAKSAEKKLLYWVAPMDPSYRRDGPGKSPMGMDLVPVYGEGDSSTVSISPAIENNMGVRTAKAERSKLWRKIDTVGYVDFDEEKISHIHLRSTGWIERLVVQSEGERVKKGQLLFELYSPELVNAQDEYLQALRSDNKYLLNASRERLFALGISRKQIKEIYKSRKVNQYVQVYASQDGIVSSLMVREGMYVMPEMEIMSLADLSTIWILAEVFESQANWVQTGFPAEVKLSYVPGREWQGKVEYIYPSLNQKTRTLKVRLRFENPDEVLKPNMFASVAIYAGPKDGVIVVPREALIRSGGDERVILAEGDGRFRPRKVVAGIESGDWVEIQHGLMEGDTVVTSGQFLIDSEASLKASLQRMQSPAADKTKPMESKQSEAMGQRQAQSMEKMVSGTGIVREVMAGESRLKLSHDPIPDLRWPEMTMFFQVNPDIKLDDFNEDDKVEFDLQQTDEGYVIQAMRKLAN